MWCDIVLIVMQTWCSIDVILLWYWCESLRWCFGVCVCVVISLWYWCEVGLILMRLRCDIDVILLWVKWWDAVWMPWRCDADVILVWYCCDKRWDVPRVLPPPTTSLSPVGWSYRYAYVSLWFLLHRTKKQPRRINELILNFAAKRLLSLASWMDEEQ